MTCSCGSTVKLPLCDLVLHVGTYAEELLCSGSDVSLCNLGSILWGIQTDQPSRSWDGQIVTTVEHCRCKFIIVYDGWYLAYAAICATSAFWFPQQYAVFGVLFDRHFEIKCGLRFFPPPVYRHLSGYPNDAWASRVLID